MSYPIICFPSMLADIRPISQKSRFVYRAQSETPFTKFPLCKLFSEAEVYKYNNVRIANTILFCTLDNAPGVN